MNDCTHHHAAKPTKRQVAAAMKSAEERSFATGHRLTPLRRRLLELLLRAGGPVKAYDFVNLLREGEAVAPATIYRTLDALASMGLAHRIASLNAYVACRGREDAHAAWFLICDCCGVVEEMSAPETAAVIASRSDDRFQIQTLEAHGRCEHCQS